MSLLRRSKTIMASAVMAAVALALPATVRAAADIPVSPYAGQETRAIKALSEREAADLLAGRGMGYALAAELNHYPGPLHVIDLADKLGLSADQRARTHAVFRAMQSEAQAIGAKIVTAERTLDSAFVTGNIDQQRVAVQTAEIGKLYGRYRATHLAAHLEMKALLTPGQVTAYDHLRGYDSPSQTAPSHQHSGQH